MTNVYQLHADSLKAVQNYLGDKCPRVQWSGKDWITLPGTAIRKKDMRQGGGGFQLNADFRFVALVSDFPGFTTAAKDAKTLKEIILQKEISYLGDVYRVGNVHIHPGGLQVAVEANSGSQNA